MYFRCNDDFLFYKAIQKRDINRNISVYKLYRHPTLRLGLCGNLPKL
ncbi:hypothetical protein CDLVIII_3925 [Clostridium sp. DL-VIII]|nr:hypothetical protein CDLVIII_3925 [Clostridium sp. DL-VIII]